MTGYATEGDEIVYESDIDVYDEAPAFPSDEAKNARCSECLAQGVLGIIQTDFLREGVDIPRADREQIIRQRIACRGKGAIERAIANEKCRIVVAQYDREGNPLSTYKPGYQTGK